MQRWFLAVSAAAILLPVSSAWANADATKIGIPQIDAGLPTGDDGNYRQHMLDWNSPSPPPPRPVQQTNAGSRALARPVSSIIRLSSTFGVRSDPLGAGSRMHSGIDIPGALGTPVMSTGAGVVAFSGRAGGYGNLVVIDHGHGLRTRYGHLLRGLVFPGEVVAAGTVIGLMGSTGRSTGSHLHYEIRIDGMAVNPLVPRYGTLDFHDYADLSDATEMPSRPVVARWQGWEGAGEGDKLPSSIIR